MLYLILGLLKKRAVQLLGLIDFLAVLFFTKNQLTKTVELFLYT